MLFSLSPFEVRILTVSPATALCVLSSSFPLLWSYCIFSRVDSISAFKGLESPVVVLAELDRISIEDRDALIHVALTRAQHHVIVLGELPKPGSQG